MCCPLRVFPTVITFFSSIRKYEGPAAIITFQSSRQDRSAVLFHSFSLSLSIQLQIFDRHRFFINSHGCNIRIVTIRLASFFQDFCTKKVKKKSVNLGSFYLFFSSIDPIFNYFYSFFQLFIRGYKFFRFDLHFLFNFHSFKIFLVRSLSLLLLLSLHFFATVYLFDFYLIHSNSSFESNIWILFCRNWMIFGL